MKYGVVGGPLDGSSVEFPNWMSVPKFYVRTDATGEFVYIYSACVLKQEHDEDGGELGYQWEKP